MDANRTRLLYRMHKGVQENGVMLQVVLPARHDESSLTWVYTVGLLGSTGHSEILIAGLPHQAAGHILNERFADIRDNLVTHESAKKYNITGDPSLETMFLTILPEHHSYWLGFGRDYHRKFCPDIKYRAVQAVWPDEKNKLPWEPGFNPKFENFQPPLWKERLLWTTAELKLGG